MGLGGIGSGAWCDTEGSIFPSLRELRSRVGVSCHKSAASRKFRRSRVVGHDGGALFQSKTTANQKKEKPGEALSARGDLEADLNGKTDRTYTRLQPSFRNLVES